MHKEKHNIINGLFWKFGESFLTQSITFVISIFLARLLLPEEYGLIAIVNIFIVFGNVFVSSGFTSALIQKRDADKLDFSTILYCSLCTSITLYIIIFFTSPYISTFFKVPHLTEVIRVYSLFLIFSSLNSVQIAYVTRHMYFKKVFYASFTSTSLSGIIGLTLAYQGYGVWSLVYQYLFNIIINSIVLFFITDWRPEPIFSLLRAKSLMNYGSKILVTDLINAVIMQLRQLLVGKFYTPTDLALFNRGNHLPEFISNNLDNTFRSVLFPAMSNASHDKEKVKLMLRRSIKMSSYLTFFFMTIMAVCSEPIIKILLTDKWVGCVPYMQIICVARALATVSNINIQAIKSIGLGNELLKLEFFKKPVFLIIVFFSVRISVYAIALTMPLYSLYALIMNIQPSKKYLNYSYIEQIKDLLPALFLVPFIIVGTLPLACLNLNDIIIVFIQIIAAFIVFILYSKIFKIEAFSYLKNTLCNYFNK